jgi:transposase-like protein
MKRNAQKEAYWREMVNRHARSGLSVSRFCAEQDISTASLYGWRKKLAQRAPKEVAPSSRPSRTRSADSANGQTFIPLAVSDSERTLEVVHPLGYRVRITGEVSAQSLKQVLDALEQRGEG